jgi:predicted MFS family arabinose efflux permease
MVYMIRGPMQNIRKEVDLAIQTAVLTTCITVVGSNSLVLSATLHEVARDLNVTSVVVSLAMTAFGSATALSSLWLALQIDCMGPRHVLAAGMGGLIAATLISTLASHWLMLFAAQALAGLAAGLILPSTYTLAAIIAIPGRESRILGRVLVGWSIAMVAAVPGAAIIVDFWGWRPVFLVLTILGIIALFGIGRLPQRQQLFITPTSPKDMITTLTSSEFFKISILLLICLLFMASAYAVFTFVGDYSKIQLGMSPTWVGLIMLAYGLGFGLGSFGDSVVDKFGPKRTLPICLAAVAIMYALMVPATGQIFITIALAALRGFANHLGLNCLVLLLSREKPEARGLVLSLNCSTTYLGVTIGVALGGVGYSTLGFSALLIGATIACALAAVLAAICLLRERTPTLKRSVELDTTVILNETCVNPDPT